VSVLVESLLRRGGDAAVSAAEDAVAQFIAFATGSGFVVFDVLVLQLRARIARADGDEVGYRDTVARYRAMANSLGFDGHIAMAEEMQKAAGHNT
jgi:adenylate cyclase